MFLAFVFQTDRRTPLVHHTQISECVGPAHARICKLRATRPDRVAGGLDLEAVEMARLDERDFLLAAVGVDNADDAGASRLTAREPELIDLDAAFCAEDPQHVFLLERHRAGKLGDDAIREGEEGRGPLVDARPAKMAESRHLGRLHHAR